MNINWFPGHMTKSLRMMDESVSLMDVLLYVLDARAPRSCINPEFNKYTERLPVIYVLNKCDLSDKAQNELWRKKLSGEKSIAVCVNSISSGSAKSIISLVRGLCREKIAKYSDKGVRAVLRGMVIGVPNAGKSTLINNLSGKVKAVTGNKAGVTRGKQWIKVDNYLEILDTPGTLYPKISDEICAHHLAYIGSIRDEIIDQYDLSLEFLREMFATNRIAIDKRYNIESVEDSSVTLQKIAKARGLMLKGGGYDTDRAAIAVLDDFRKGRIDSITLDKCV